MEFVSYFDYRKYDPVVPRVEDGLDPRRACVAIVGGGPVGLALALGLARHGIASVVLEADDSVCLGSRAGCVTSRTLEVFEHLGMADPVMRQGLPWADGWSYHRMQEVFHLQVPQNEAGRFPKLVNIQQCYIEQYMVDVIERNYGDLIEIRWQSQVTAVEPHEDGVSLRIATPRQEYTLAADWVIAGDGARSTVRKALGLRMAGTRYEGSYVIADIRMRSALPAGRRAWFDPPSNPGATLLLHKHRDDLWRFDYQLREDEDPAEAVKPENVLERIRSHLALMGETAPWQPVWISLYRASCLTLERYRHGRVLFAGDAAHLVPIFGVRGLNSGIEDGCNLAWKLAFRIRGWAGDELLDTYTDERLYAMRENMRHASKSAEFMAPPSGAFKLMRRAVLDLAHEHRFVRTLIDPRQSSAIAYAESPLNAADSAADFSAGPAPGASLLDGLLPDGRHLCQALGLHFTVLAFDVPGPDGGAAALDGTPPMRVLHAACDSDLGRAYGARPGSVYLFRPDGNVLGRWRAFDAPALRQAVRVCCQGGRA